MVVEVNPHADYARYYVLRTPVKAAKYYFRHRDSEDPDTRLRAEALRAALGTATRCWVCGRELENEVSKAAGIGPDCAERLERAR